MKRYWVKIDDAVEGPFEGNLLRYVEGFTPETLVSPDDPAVAEIWQKASDVEELSRLYGNGKNGKNGAETHGEKTQEIKLPPKEVEILPTDMLDLMEKISLEVSKDKEKFAAPLPAPEIDWGVPEAEKSPGKKKLIFSALGVVALAGIAFALWKLGYLTRKPAPVEQAKVEPAPLPVPPVAPPAPPKPEKKPEPPKKIIAKKAKPSKVVKVVKKPEAPLQYQKFVLPGVPSPNLKASTQTVIPEGVTGNEKAIPETTQTTQTAAPAEKVKEESKQKTKKQFEEVEWQNQTGWGK